MREANSTKPRNSPLAWILGLVLFAFVVAILWPVHSGGDRSPDTACLSNVKQCATGHLIYASDYDDLLPNRDRWMDDLVPYTKNPDIFKCTVVIDKKKPDLYGYCFNGALSEVKVPELAETVPLVFDSINLARNASGSLDSLPKPGRHGKDRPGNSIAYADGHVKRVQ